MKVLVVEDEAPIRESLVRSLNRMGYNDVLEASNGIEAIGITTANHPDIALVDIKMPKMDGIQFISEIKKVSAETVYIIISGYDTFEYAQKAISLGVFAYLLKPVKDSELESLMGKIVENLSESRKIQDSKYKDKMKSRKYLEHARKKFILELVQEQIQQESIINDTLQELEMQMHEGLFTVLTIYIDNFDEICNTISSRDLDLFKFSIENIAIEIFSELGVNTYGFNIDQRLGFLLSLPWKDITDFVKLHASFYKIRDNFSKYFGFTLTISAGHPVESLSLLHKSLLSANKAAMLRFVKGGNQVFIGSGDNPVQKKTVNIDLETEQKLLIQLKTCSKKEALNIITNLYQPFYLSAPDNAELLMKLNFQIIYTVYRIMDQLGYNLEQVTGSEIELYKQLNSLSGRSKVEEFFSRLLDTCITKLQEQQMPWNKRIIAKAMDYLLEYYNTEISVGMVAEHVNISQSYFSKLFKEEYDESFTDFLTKLRINKAMDYLRQGIYTVNEVSKMVGFHDEKYFHRSFKKATGITPGNYKKT